MYIYTYLIHNIYIYNIAYIIYIYYIIDHTNTHIYCNLNFNFQDRIKIQGG